MPSQQEVRWSQLKVGVIVLVAVVILTTLLFLVTSSSGLGVLSKKITVHTYFENSAGLKVGAPVNLEGVTIGTVKSVTVSTDPNRKLTPVDVLMKIDGKYQKGLHVDSKAALTTLGVLGDTVVDINSQVAVGPEIKSGAELQTLASPNLTDVIKASQGTVESLNMILAKMNIIVDNIQTGKGSVGMLINDRALYDKATATVNELQTLTQSLNSSKGTVGKLIQDPQLYDRLNDTAGKLDNIASELDAGKGTAGKLLKDDSLYNNLNSTLKHANSLLAEADEGKGALGLMTKDPAFARKLDSTVTQLDTILTNVNGGKGTLGKLAVDEAAYNNLNNLLVSSNDLVTTIRKDPKKYLTIHMKIF
jgi:phospholipid/cholesterol/gamma-HCH transport system substrate-binding protein